MKTMRAIGLIYLLMAWSFAASAQELGEEFTLRGKSLFGAKRSQECFLYVDKIGEDPQLPWFNKFFAVVRTSFEPRKSILLVSQNRFEMTSINENGRPTPELKVRLRGQANGQSLLHATSFDGVTRRPLQRISCIKLLPIAKDVVE